MTARPDDAHPYPGSSIFFHDEPASGVLRLWLDTGLPGKAITHENHHEFSTIRPTIGQAAVTPSAHREGVGRSLCTAVSWRCLTVLQEAFEAVQTGRPATSS